MKKFKATWGSGYYNPGSKIITMDYITEENGWWPENIEAIEESEIGQIINCSDISGVLHVERIS